MQVCATLGDARGYDPGLGSICAGDNTQVEWMAPCAQGNRDMSYGSAAQRAFHRLPPQRTWGARFSPTLAGPLLRAQTPKGGVCEMRVHGDRSCSLTHSIGTTSGTREMAPLSI